MLFAYNGTIDNGNLYCANKNCSLNTNIVYIKNNPHKIKYRCDDCGRTLIYNNKEIFGNHELADGWLHLNEFGVYDACDKCEKYVLSLNYTTCTICGIINKGARICGNDEHKTVESNREDTDALCGEGLPFVKNPNDEKCKYCNRYLMKCVMCDDACYVCVFDGCNLSQLNGAYISEYSYLCKNHSIGAINRWTEIYSEKDASNYDGYGEKCEDCGTMLTCYKSLCTCRPTPNDPGIYLCINCHCVDYAVCRLYCGFCY